MSRLLLLSCLFATATAVCDKALCEKLTEYSNAAGNITFGTCSAPTDVLPSKCHCNGVDAANVTASIAATGSRYAIFYTGENCATPVKVEDSLLQRDGNAGWLMLGDKQLDSVLVAGIIGSVIALATAVFFTLAVMKQSPGPDGHEMLALADMIHKGAKDFLRAEYKWLVVFVIFIFVAVSCLLIGSKTPLGVSVPEFGLYTAIPLLFGATLSASAGWGGMWIATKANVRTAYACDPSQGGSINKGLGVAFKSGAVMSMSVTGLGLLGMTLFYAIYSNCFSDEAQVWQYLSGFGFGASCIALFARVGGGATPRLPTSAPTWQERSWPASPRTIPVTRL